MQTQIKFIVSGANSQYGGFSAGDTMRVPLDIAAHFVEIGIAKFMDAPKVEEAKPTKPVKDKK